MERSLHRYRNKNIAMLLVLKISLLLLVAIQNADGAEITHIDQLEPEGSGDDIEECLTTFEGYDDYFLRGVKEEFFVTYNKTTFEDCMRYCCAETHFECNSFSYFVLLKVCYVMNMTKHSDVAHLAHSIGWKHYHRVQPGGTTDETMTTVFDGTSSEAPRAGKRDDVTDNIPTTTIKSNCQGRCKNGGTCEFIRESETEKSQLVEGVSKCSCKPGYGGNFCEKSEALKLAGVPPYVIAVAVIGFIIFLLFAAVLIIYVLYRKRTGKYRVKQQRERWNKRARQTQARRAQSFNSVPARSPGGSELSVPGSVNSSGTISTTTSV